MKITLLILAFALSLSPLVARADSLAPSPLSPQEAETLRAMEQDAPAEDITAGDFSADTERSAMLIQIAILAASLTTASVLVGLFVVWRRSRAAGTDSLASLTPDRRAATRYPMASTEATITLHTPFGEINAAPVDISESGMQILVQEERANGTTPSQPMPSKIKISLNRAGEQGARLLDTIPCMICWVCKDRLGLRFEHTIALDTLFAQRVAVPVPL